MASQAPIRKRITPSFPFTLEVELDGGAKQVLGLRLSYDMNAACLVEEKTGYSGLSGAIFKNLTAANMTILLWAMVQANHPEYVGEDGLIDVRSLLTMRNSGSASEAVEECFIRNLPDDKQKEIRAALAAKAAGNKPETGGELPLAETTPTPAV